VAEPKREQFAQASVKRNTDGSLANPRYEMFAVILADRFSVVDAWNTATIAITGKPSSSSGGHAAYRNKVYRDQLFKGRLSMLEIERDQLEADDTFGDLTWVSKQLYRVSMAKMDATGIGKAASLLMDIAKMKVERDRVQEPGEPRGPGRKAVENPSKTLDLARIGRELVEKGLKNPSEMAEIAADDADEIEFS
jgi:hypothetical protein